MPAPTKPSWSCPRCRRKFARVKQQHICSSGSRQAVLKKRRPEVVALFEALEAQVRGFGPVEFVPREKYIIIRSKHIFADLVMLADSLRLVVHLPHMVRHPLFRKVMADGRWVSHEAKLRKQDELTQMEPYLRAAWEFAQSY